MGDKPIRRCDLCHNRGVRRRKIASGFFLLPRRAAMLPESQAAAGVSYRESGRKDAPVLVLLHGIGSTSAGWRLQYGPLGERFRVIAWDAPGYGGSAPLAGEAPPVEAYARA